MTTLPCYHLLTEDCADHLNPSILLSVKQYVDPGMSNGKGVRYDGQRRRWAVFVDGKFEAGTHTVHWSPTVKHTGNDHNKRKNIPIILGIVGLLFIRCGILDNRYSIDLNGISIQIVNPVNNANIAPGDTIVFRAGVNTAFSHLRCVWSIPDDNIEFTQPASDSTIIEYRCPGLSKGVHTIHLYIFNDDGEMKSTSIVINTLIKLYPPHTPKDTVFLNWSPVDTSIFSAYLIYCNDACIDTVYQNEDTTYSDIYIFNGTIYNYQIRAKTKDGREISSNEQIASPGSVITLNMPVRKAVVNRKTRMVYAIAGTRNPRETYGGIGGLIIIDAASNRMVKQVLPAIRFSDMSFDESTGTIGLCNGIDNKIWLINSNNFDRITAIPVFRIAQKLEIGNNRRIYYIADSGLNQICKLMVLDIEKKSEIVLELLLDGEGYHEDIELSNDNRYIYYSSAHGLHKIDVTFDSIPRIVKSVAVSLSHDNSSLVLSEQNTKVCIENHIYDKDLNWFCCTDINSTENILAISPRDSVALGQEYLYDLNLKTKFDNLPFSYNSGLFLSESEFMLISSHILLSGSYKSFFYYFPYLQCQTCAKQHIQNNF